MTPPSDLVTRLQHFGQLHLLTGWDRLTPLEQTGLIQSLQSCDFAELARLYAERTATSQAVPHRGKIAPLPVQSAGKLKEYRAVGEACLRAGQAAALIVAGGQGSRLGFDKPKGLFPVGPVSGASLFQIHAERVLALSRRYHFAIPFLVMTSPATHPETVSFFEQNRFFRLDPAQVHFFQQGTMPALDLATGQVLLEAPGKLFLSPNGHGGTLTALSDSGLLARLKAQGIEQIFYFQVDNPLVQILDPGFLGMHVQHQAEVSSKVVFKEKPEEKVGVLAQIDGHCGIIEYSDMPKEMTEERLPDGTLTFRAGNPAIHLFHVPFLERVSSGADRLKYHMARKKVPFYDPACGDSVTPVTENALKFELFIFDALPMADRWLAVETLREEEFAPLKNASGADSLETCQALQIARAQRWLRSAGVTVADSVSVELAPTFALDPSDLVGRFPEGTTLTSPRYIR